jgi:hypothetical protein
MDKFLVERPCLITSKPNSIDWKNESWQEQQSYIEETKNC